MLENKVKTEQETLEKLEAEKSRLENFIINCQKQTLRTWLEDALEETLKKIEVQKFRVKSLVS
jgi:hypothetical protein